MIAVLRSTTSNQSELRFTTCRFVALLSAGEGSRCNLRESQYSFTLAFKGIDLFVKTSQFVLQGCNHRTVVQVHVSCGIIRHFVLWDLGMVAFTTSGTTAEQGLQLDRG